MDRAAVVPGHMREEDLFSASMRCGFGIGGRDRQTRTCVDCAHDYAADASRVTEKADLGHLTWAQQHAPPAAQSARAQQACMPAEASEQALSGRAQSYPPPPHASIRAAWIRDARARCRSHRNAGEEGEEGDDHWSKIS